MKDAYSFDRDEDGVRRELRARTARPTSGSSSAAGSRRTTSRPRAGSWAASSASTSSRRPARARTRSSSARTATTRPISRWRAAIPRAPIFPERLDAPEEVETPGVTTIEALAEFLGIDAAATSKAMPVVKDDGTLVLALIRGDDRLSETKLLRRAPGASRPATDDEIRAAFGASGGSLGPIGFEGEILADETLREGQFVAGANRDGRHLRGVRGGPRLRAALRRPARAPRGRPLPRVRRRARLPDGDRGRAHLQLRHASTPGRWRRRSSTRTARRSRSSAAATASAPAA